MLERFEQEYEWSELQNKLVLDTSEATVDETLAGFLKRHEPFMSNVDNTRMARKQVG